MIPNPTHSPPLYSRIFQGSSSIHLTLPKLWLGAIVVTGIFFRVWQYAYNRSLWLDEAFLANNIVLRSFGELLLKPLGANQGAPIGFVILLKTATSFLGETEFAMRLVSLLSGLLSLLVCYKISFSVFNNTTARSCFLSLMSFSPILIYYSSELKQYSMDVLASLCILWAALNFRRWHLGFFRLALIGSIAVWLSHPSVFVMLAVGTVLMVKPIQEKAYDQAYKLGLVIFAWVVNFAGVYVLSLRNLSVNKALVSYWKSGYAPFPIRSFDDILWFWESALGLIHMTFLQSSPTDPAAHPDWFAPLNIVLLVLACIGTIFLYIISKRFFAIIVLLFAVTMAVSALELYPFRNRLILFLVPCIFVLVSSMVDWLAGSKTLWKKATAWLITLPLMSLLLFPSLGIALKPHNSSDLKSVLAYIRTESSPNDQVALSVWSCYAFFFYVKRFGLQHMRVASVIPAQNDTGEFLNDLLRKRALRRTWVVFTHRFHERRRLLAQLRSLTPLLQSYEGDGAGAYLFDFSML